MHKQSLGSASFKIKLIVFTPAFYWGSRNRDQKHSACFISKDYKAFTCRIIGQKVQRVPALEGAREAIDVCLLTT